LKKDGCIFLAPVAPPQFVGNIIQVIKSDYFITVI